MIMRDFMNNTSKAVLTGVIMRHFIIVQTYAPTIMVTAENMDRLLKAEMAHMICLLKLNMNLDD